MTCKATPSSTQSLSGGFAILMLWTVLTLDAPKAAHANETSRVDTVASEGEHLVRRCKLGSKQELCYWAKVGSHPNSER